MCHWQLTPPNESILLGRMSSFLFRSPAVHPALPLAGWQSCLAWLVECSPAWLGPGGPFSLFAEVDREGGSERMACCGG